jgi:hypothetical protein
MIVGIQKRWEADTWNGNLEPLRFSRGYELVEAADRDVGKPIIRVRRKILRFVLQGYRPEHLEDVPDNNFQSI